MKVELYQPFHELFSTVGETTNQLLKLCQDDEMRKLLLRQQEAVAKALKDYCEILNKKAWKEPFGVLFIWYLDIMISY